MPNENDRRTFTTEDAQNIPLDVLKNSYFFLDQDLTLRRLTTETRPGNGDKKGAVNTHTIEDVVVISRDTKGKLLELYESDILEPVAAYAVNVQFDTDESCFLQFVAPHDFRESEFSIVFEGATLSTDVKYNGILYHTGMDISGNVRLEFQLRETTETVTSKAKGAW